MSPTDPNETPALDSGDVDPDLLAGDPVEAEHDLDVDTFADDDLTDDAVIA